MSAVQWFASQLGITTGSMFEKAKQMEKQQIIDAYQAGDGDAYNLKETEGWAKEYYNETYGSNETNGNNPEKVPNVIKEEQKGISVEVLIKLYVIDKFMKSKKELSKENLDDNE